MTDAIRESFEAWAKSQRICVDRDPRGGYVWRSSQTAWEAWQAALASDAVDVIATYTGKDARRGWVAQGAWLKPGQVLAVVSGRPEPQE